MSNNVDPAEAGSELQDPTMSKQQSDDPNVAPKPAEAINGYSGLYARFDEVNKATVLSLRNGDVSAYRCNITSLTCSKRDGTDCEDLEYNCSGKQICDHLAAAIYAADKSPNPNLAAINGATSIMDMARDAAKSAQSTADSLRAARNAHAAESAQNASQNGASPDNGDSMDAEDAYSGYDVEDLKGDLREALEARDFDVNEMGTGTYQGTDQIKFDVSHEDFDYLKRKTSECDMVGYDGDMNAVNAKDVEKFIEYEL